MLLVGPTTSGKTLFSKQFQEYLSKGRVITESDLQSTIPTVGTTITTLSLSRKDNFDMRELGGSMAPIWKKYYKDSGPIIFLADKSNPQQLSACFILLMEMLTSADLSAAPFLIIWNKTDSAHCMTDSYIKNIINLDQIRAHASQKIDSIDCSSLTGDGFEDVAAWMRQLRT